jgi:hypothetical protein
MNIGVLVPNFGVSQLMYSFVQNANDHLTSSANPSITGFFDNPAPLQLIPKFPLMQSHEAWAFPGILIATNLRSATKMLQCPGTKKKLFYVWDMEWLYEKNRSYLEFAQFYLNKEIELLARSADHAEAIEDCWNRKVFGIVEDFNMKQLIEALEKYGTDQRIPDSSIH